MGGRWLAGGLAGFSAYRPIHALGPPWHMPATYYDDVATIPDSGGATLHTIVIDTVMLRGIRAKNT